MRFLSDFKGFQRPEALTAIPRGILRQMNAGKMLSKISSTTLLTRRQETALLMQRGNDLKSCQLLINYLLRNTEPCNTYRKVFELLMQTDQKHIACGMQLFRTRPPFNGENNTFILIFDSEVNLILKCIKLFQASVFKNAQKNVTILQLLNLDPLPNYEHVQYTVCTYDLGLERGSKLGLGGPNGGSSYN